MDEETKTAYKAGAVSLLGCVILIIFAINFGWNMTGQVLGIMGLFFGILGVGSFIKPEIFGPIADQILENIGKSSEERTTIEQKQHAPKDSPQVSTGKGDIHYHQTTKS